MNISLHPHQLDIFNDPARFKVVAAGRRFGKSYLAAVKLYVEGAKTHKVRTDGVEVELSLEEVYYIAPTYEQGKRIMWPLLKEIGEDLIAQKYENEGRLTLVNGRRISIKGADKPDSLRGVGLSYVVLDEFAFMKDYVWEMIVYPQLARSEGGALFIGTPEGKNHFYHLWLKGHDEEFPEWRSWSYSTNDNPFIPQTELYALTQNMSAEVYRQEIEAQFQSAGGAVLTKDMFSISKDLPYPGDDYITVDLAGFAKSEGGRKIKKRDEHAIAVVRNHAGGWYIKDVIHGQWDVRETALRIIKAYRDHRPRALGIEKGMAMNAILPYLKDEMNRLGIYFNVSPLTHGNQRKTDRIAWALQGRAEKGRIVLAPGDWNKPFLEQASDFPSPLSHDDLIDAVSYIDQISEPWFDGPDMIDDWEPLDAVSGY